MDLREFFGYFKRLKWILIIPVILCTALSGFLTYFTKYSYVCTPKIIIGPQTQVNKDAKFTSSIVYILADLASDEKVLTRLANETGLNLDKDKLKSMVSTITNDQYQRVYLVVTGADEKAVRVIAQKIPDIVSDTARELFNIDNLLVIKSDKVVVSGRNYKKNIISGAVAGIGIGLLIIFILLTIDKSIRDKKLLSRLFNIDYLGSIRRQQKNSDSDEGISTLSTRILLMARNSKTKTAAIIALGTKNDEGHVYEIAKQISLMDKKVLLIGLDKDSDKVIPADTKGGFDLSKTTREIEPNIFSTPFNIIDTMDISDVAKLDMENQIKNIRDIYDLVFLSIPQTMGIDKTLLLSHAMDSSIISVKKNVTTVKDAEKLLSSLRDTGINTLGYYVVD